MDALKRLFGFGRRPVTNAQRRCTPTASQQDMDRLLELTWRQRVARNRAKRLAQMYRERQGAEEPEYLKRQAL
jgi:hypothetical protein